MEVNPMEQNEIQKMLSEIEHPSGYSTYTPRDIEVMHNHFAMDKLKKLREYVDELLFKKRYHNEDFTTESVDRINKELHKIIGYLT